MIDIKDKKNCSGCGACYQACPKNCISMKSDSEGFRYPVVDSLNCIKCNLCENVCPIINKKPSSEECIAGYVAKSLDNTRTVSSSGGIFYLLARKVIEDGGIVVGASYDDELLVRHEMISDVKDLPRLMGSKYMQSNLGDIYSEIKKELDNSRAVLFSGTACQVAGLKSYLRKDYSNLFTVDVLCHGVPSPYVWKRYVSGLEEKYGARVSKVDFRNKISGWKNYSFSACFENGEVYETPYMNSEYMKLFIQNYILRPSCYDCSFKSLKRDSDLTIGDAWGIDKVEPDFDDDKGTSVIVTHTEKGEILLEKIEENLKIKRMDIDTILPPSADSRKSVNMPSGRALTFFYLRRNKSITKLMEATQYNTKNKILKKIIRNK